MAQLDSHAPTTPSDAPTISSDEAQRILRTLHKSDYESERRRIPSWTPRSCEWFLEEPLYQSWKEEQKSSFLWLSGPQGCGKSVLASFLVEELSSAKSQKKLPGTVCYFFFNAGNKEHQNPLVALYAILHQLLSKLESSLVGYASPVLGTQGQAGTSQFTTVWRILSSVMADPQCGNVLCIVDGLSECLDRVAFINSMARFYSERETDETKGGLLKIIATTQVVLEPSSAPSKRLEQVKMKSMILAPKRDHRLFIKTRVEQISSIRGFSQNVQTQLINHLIYIKNATFLSISLVLDWLENSTGNEPERLLQSMNLADADESISDVYEMSLGRCPDRPTTQRLLHMVLAAAEPLTLEEINMAMRVTCGAQPTHQNPEAVSAEMIKLYCGPLLRVVDSRVIFSHQTAREFLIEPAHATSSGQWKHSLNVVESNKVLADICVSYLSRLDFSNNLLVINRDASGSNIEQKPKHGLLEYAAKHWAEHFVDADEPPSLVDSAVSLCDPSSDGFKTWFQVYWTCAYPTFSLPHGITNLMVDSHFGHVSVLERRKKTKNGSFDVNAKDDRGWTAMHWAAQSGKLEIVESLLELNPDLSAETKEKRTAIEFAAGKGYEPIVQILLDKANKEPASLIPPNLRRRSSTFMPTSGVDKVRSLMLLNAAYEGNEALVRRLLEQSTRPNQTDSRGFTPLHKAASQNNFSIVRLLLEKGRADIDRRADGGETALALASQKGHEATVKLLLGRGANTESYDSKNIFSGAAESVRGLLLKPPIVRGPSLVPRPPSPPPLIPDTFQNKEKSHPSHDFHATILDLWFQDHEERSQFAHPTVHDLLYSKGPNAIMAPLLQGATPTTPTFRWLHLPANNLIWVKDLVSKIYHERISKPGKFRPSHFEAKLKRVDRLFDAGQQYRAPKDSAVHARFFRPTCRGVNIGEKCIPHKSVNPETKISKNKKSEQKLPNDEGGKDDTASKDTDIVLFMPFLHYETDGGRDSIAKAVESARQGGLNRKALEGESSAGKKLIHTYLHEKSFMHVRRTLDQYYYHTMKDTTQRDRDQVVFRWAKKMWPDEPEHVHNILMVDQLWLWILDGDTVITSFPQRWDREQHEDDLDVVESLKKHIQLREGRDPLRSAFDLAVLISSFCSEVFFEREDAPEPLDERLQFLEFFDKSIGHVTASETACFDRLANFFKDLDNKSREAEGYFIQAMEKEVEDDNISGPTLDTEKPYDVFYNIGEEAALLREIKDIRDELNIITKVFLDQQKALETMHKLVRAKVSFSGKEPSSDILRRIKRHMSDIKEIDDHASRTYEALNHLLDLKQKHANVCEARWTREQAQETAKQSNTIMVFTIVTIIFLPLSFMATFFALNIVQFPKELELNYVARYLLGVSAAIIVPFLIIAFNVNRMSRHLRTWFDQFKETGFGTWLAIWILRRLGRLDKKREATLRRRRENKKNKNEERRNKMKRSSSSSSHPTAPAPSTVPISEKTNHRVPNPGEILEDGRRSNGTTQRVLSGRSLESGFSRRSLGVIDEESQTPITRWGKSKAKTFPSM